MSENILQFTDKAVEHIKKSLSRFPKGGFRLTVKKTGCSGYKYVPEVVPEPKEGDIQFKSSQDLIVFLDPAWLEVLKGVQVDLVSKSLGQKQLVFYNPNVTGECGCGESFNLPKHKKLEQEDV